MEQEEGEQQQQQQLQQQSDVQQPQRDGVDDDSTSPPEDDGGPKRPPPNHDHGILTTKDGTPLIRLRSKKSIMESRFKLTMRTWDDVWKSTAWAKFAPDKLKQTLQRSTRNQGELKVGNGAAGGSGGAKTSSSAGKANTTAVQVVKKSRFKVVPHVQIDDQPAAVVPAKQRSTPKPPLSSSGSSDTDSDRLPAGLPMIESNLNELTMVESELKKLEREHVAKHQLLTPNNDAESTEKTSSTADDSRKPQGSHQKPRGGGGGTGEDKKDKSPKVGSRAAETHSKRLGWLKAFRRKSSAADTGSDTTAVTGSSSSTTQPAAATTSKPAKHKQQTAGKSSSGRQSSSSPRQQQRQRASARPRQQHHTRAAAVPTATTIANVIAITSVSHNTIGLMNRK